MTDKINVQDMDDHAISNLVRSVRYKIPDEIDENVTDVILKSQKKDSRYSPKLMMWFRMSLTAAAVMIVVIAIYLTRMTPTFTPEPALQISEIKTELNLNDKNIKILWVQKRDFKLARRQE